MTSFHLFLYAGLLIPVAVLWHHSHLAGDTLRILRELRSEAWLYRVDLMRRVNMRASRFYTALARLEQAGLVEARWEPSTAGLRRRYYRATRP